MKACVLTGAGGAIGGAIARSLVDDGWRVLGLDLAFRDDDGEPPPLSERVVCDLTDEARLRDCLRALAEVEPVRGLVNCAGHYPVEAFAESDSTSWRRQIDVNFLAPAITCHALLPGMIDEGWGRIVNITSDSSRTGASRLAVYAGTKGGLLSFSKSLAQEVGRMGVTVNCVSPGTIEVPTTDRDMAAKLARKIPVGRLGAPGDVAAAVAFLMSDAAEYITGEVLSVGGGLTMAS